jgi:uncharacterized protein
VLTNGQPMITRKPNFPAVRYEVYFDIESDPLNGVDYLLGFLVKDTQKDTVEYKYCLAKSKEEEPKAWLEFLDYLASLEDFVIYHYAFFERQVFERLATRYGAPTSLLEKFRENTIDLHTKLVDSAVLPIYFYSLKDVGAYLNYKWDDPHAGGAESILWYKEWLEKGDPAIIKKILRYNEDDVRATMRIKDWLADQKPSKLKEKESLDD